jgi:glycosyltransferase involved in cell wall biosynthesis
MWAFALWDANEEKLVLGRDHFGIKPLYYYITEDLKVLASEIGAFFSQPLIKRNPNERVVYNYLVDGGVDRTEETFFEGLCRLIPGHYATVTPDGSIEKTQYWRMPSISEEANYEDMEKASEQVRKLFVDAVRIRLISHVPVGTCLSGGLDSSSIVSVIAGLRDEDKKNSDRVVAVSQDLLRSINNLGLTDAVYIPNCVKQRDDSLSAESMNGHNVLFVGTLTKRKRVDVLTQAFHKVGSRVPDAKLTIAGIGPFRQPLEKLVSMLRLTDKVRYVRYVFGSKGSLV